MGDLFKIMPLVNLWSGEKWQQEKDEFFNNTFPARLPALVKMLGEKQYFCGNFVTYATLSHSALTSAPSLHGTVPVEVPHEPLNELLLLRLCVLDDSDGDGGPC